jgi:LydA holin phage, holin superfamily III
MQNDFNKFMEYYIMPEKDPMTYSAITYLWVFVLSMWGGAVSFIGKVKIGQVRAFNIVEFFGELFISAFSGLVTFYLCEASGIDRLYETVFVAISGHMGARIIFTLEKVVERKLNATIAVIDSGVDKNDS